MRNFNNSTMADDNYNTSQSNLTGGQAVRQVAGGEQQQQQPPLQQRPIRTDSLQELNDELAAAAAGTRQPSVARTTRIADEMSQDLQYLSREAPLDGGESTFGGAYSTLGGGGANDNNTTTTTQQHTTYTSTITRTTNSGGSREAGLENDYERTDFRIADDEEEATPTSRREQFSEPPSYALEQLAPDNVDLQRPLQQAGFLVSFMVDARGGAMRGCRHSGVRVIIPPGSAQQPMRITCRYLRRERLVHPPPLMEGEACASKIMEVGPAGVKFLGPVLIEVPHFASLRGKEREIIILRSDTGEVWREHLVEASDELVDSIIDSAKQAPQDEQQQQQENVRPVSADGALNRGGGDSQQQEKRLTRIVTDEFPQYFAIISRIRQQLHSVGPDGSVVDSQVVPKVQAIFTEGALTKRIKIGLQKKQSPDQSPQLEAKEANNQHNHASTQLVDTADRPQSPESTGTGNGAGRPSSAAAKRRSRFLACFGASQGSSDPLDQQHQQHTTDGEFASGSAEDSSLDHSAGDNSPRQKHRQPVHEKPFERRHIIEDISDSEQEADLSPRSRKKRSTVNADFVPVDYYREQESSLILNVEPTTYGKRLASSSAQTDQKLQTQNGFMSTSTRSTKSKRRGLLGGGGGGGGSGGGGKRNRRNKTQMTIPLHEPLANQQARRPQSPAVDSSLESQGLTSGGFESLAADSEKQLQTDAHQYKQNGLPADSKWLTRTIQTDSDSVTVQYVTIYGTAPASAGEEAPKATSGQDDGYVSGSGELKKDAAHGHKSKGRLFSPFCGVSSKADDDEQLADDETDVQLKLNESGQLDVDESTTSRGKRKSRAKKGAKSSGKKSPQPTNLDIVIEAKTPDLELAHATTTSSPTPTDEATTAPADVSVSRCSVSPPSTSAASSSKELKLKMKLEKAEKAKREKLEKAKQKELEEAASKAEKAKRKLEKEAKKKAAKVSGSGAKLPVLEASAASPTGGDDSSSVSSAPATQDSKSQGFNLSTTIAKTIQSVKFAPSPSKTSDEPVVLESGSPIEEVTQQSSSSSKENDDDGGARASPSKKMVIDSISLPKFKLPKLKLGGGGSADKTPKATIEAPEVDEQPDSMVHVSIGAETSLPTLEKPMVELPEVESICRELSVKPKGILKQKSGSIASAELTIGEQPQTLKSIATELVSEATEAAVRAADELQKQQQRALESSPTLSLSLNSSASESKKELAKKLKAERAQLKREAQAKLEEEKKFLKEAEEAAKQAQEAAKRALNEANKVARDLALEAELQARIAMQEAERAVKESSESAQQSVELSAAELKRQAKKAEAEAKRRSREAEEELKKKTKEAKEEAKRAAKEAKKKLKLGLKVPTLVGSSDSSTADDNATTASVSQRFEASAAVEASGVPIDETKNETSVGVAAVEIEPTSTSSGDVEEQQQQQQQAKKVKSTGGLDIKLPKFNLKFGGARKQGDENERVNDDGDKEKVGALEGVEATIPIAQVTKDNDDGDAAKAKKSKQKKAKAKKQKGSARSSVSSLSAAETSEPTASKSSSFLGRLFRAKPKAVDISGGEVKLPEVEPAEVDLPKVDLGDGQAERVKRETTMIVSEMYPSDPNNTEGEMILEVNVPENLISNNNNNVEINLKPQVEQQQQQQQQQQKITTTVTSLSSTVDDQEATLVNISQTLADSDDDDEATENVLSQAHELPLDSAVASAGEPQAQISTTSEHQPHTPPVQMEESAVVVRTSGGGHLLEKIPEDQQEESSHAASEQPAAALQVERPAAGTEVPTLPADSRELKSEKNRKELEAKLDKEAKKRAKEEAKLAKKREKEAKKLAEVEAKKRAQEDKERVKREAKEAKRLAELAKREAKDAKKRAKSAKSTKSAKSEPEVTLSKSEGDDVQEAAEAVTSSTSTAILTTTTTMRGDQANLLPEEPTIGAAEVDPTSEGRLVLSSKREIPVNEETEVERIVEEVVGEDGTVTKTTKTIETKYITMRQEELRVAERRDMPADEWQRVQAERAAAAAQNKQPQEAADESQIVTSEARVELMAAEEAELSAICATPSFFDPHTLPAEIKPETAPKKAMKKRVRLNQKLIKRALKCARAEAKKAKKSQKRAEAEIGVCDEASRQARKQLKRAVSEAKRAAKEAQKRHKKMDKMDKKLAKRAKKLEKRQKEIDKKVAKLEKKAAKKREKLAKREAKEARRSPSRSSKKSLKLEDIGEPILKSSGGSRLSIQRQRSADQEEDLATTSGSARNTVSTSGDLQVDMSIEPTITSNNHNDELTQDQINQLIRDGKESVVHTITKTIIIEGQDGEPARVETSEQVLRGPEAEEAALRLELGAARDEDEDVQIDVVGVDDGDELQRQSSQETPEVSETSEPTTSSSSSKKNKNKNKRNKNKKSMVMD